jgi:hypothetical protein
MGAIAKALRARGLAVRETFDRVPPEAVVFVWSWKWSREILDKHPHTVVCTLDHGLLHPRNKTAVTGWMGLNGLGEHPLVLDAGKRLQAKGWGSMLRPWREPDPRRTALILGQCYNDVQILDHLEDYGQWLMDRAKELRAEGWRVSFRPHPVQRRNDLSRYPNVGSITNGATVFDDIDQLRVGCVVGFNSNALLDSFMYGVQDVRVYNEGSMLWPIVDKQTHRADTSLRQPLADLLAFCQWEPAEIESGEWADYHIPIMRRLLSQRPAPLRPWHQTEVRYAPR